MAFQRMLFAIYVNAKMETMRQCSANLRCRIKALCFPSDLGMNGCFTVILQGPRVV
jgi:hypothetical protein